MNSLTAKQLTEWEVFLSIDPLGQRKQDYRLAYIASLITNLVIRTMGKKGDKLTNLGDFLIEWDAEEANRPKVQSVQSMKELLLGLASTHNKKFEEK